MTMTPQAGWSAAQNTVTATAQKQSGSGGTAGTSWPGIAA
ncbi:rhsK domain protein, partial [Escherichia coli DEC5B]